MLSFALVVVSAVLAYMPPPPFYQQPPPQPYQPGMMPQPQFYEPIVNPFSKRNIGRYLKHKMLKPIQPLIHSLTDPYYGGNYSSPHQYQYDEYYPEEYGSEEYEGYDLYHRMQKKQFEAERKIGKINEMMQMMMLMSMNPNVNRGELYKLMMYSMAPKDMRRIMELTMMNVSPYNQPPSQSPFYPNQSPFMSQASLMVGNSSYQNPFNFPPNPMGFGQSQFPPSPFAAQTPYNPCMASPPQMGGYFPGAPQFASLPQWQQQQLFNQLYNPSLNQTFNSPLGPYQVPGCSPLQLQTLGLTGSSPYSGSLNITDTNSTCLPYLLQYMRDRDMRRRLRALEEFETEDYNYGQRGRPGFLERLLGGGGGFGGNRPFFRGPSSGSGFFGGSSSFGGGDYNMMRPRCMPQSDMQWQQSQMQMQQLQQQLAQQQAMIQQMNQMQAAPMGGPPPQSSSRFPPWRRR